MSDDDVNALLAAAEQFAEARNLTLETAPINLFGFGTVNTLFRTPEGGWWCALPELSEPTGLSVVELLVVFRAEDDELGDDVGVMSWVAGGRHHQLEMVSHHFAMRVLAGPSPWSGEYLKNTYGLMRHAMLRSGLANLIGPAYVVGDDGIARRSDKTFADHIAEDLPPEDEATAKAFAGPVLTP